MAARDAAVYRAHRMFDGALGRLAEIRVLRKKRLRFLRRQLGDHFALAVGGQAVGVDEELVGLEAHRHALGHVLPGKVEDFAGGRVAERRDEDHLARVQAPRDPSGVDLAYGAGELEIDAVAHADRLRGDVVARGDADLRARHGRVRQPLREQRLDLDAQHAGGFLHRLQRPLVGDAQPVHVARAYAARLELGLDLGPSAVHQREPDAERGQDADVVDEAREASALREHLAAEGDDEGAAAKGVQIRRDLAEPAHEALGMLRRRHLVFSTNCTV